MHRLTIAALCGTLAAPAFGATFFGPTPYLSLADSPFLGSPNFTLEDFEDGLFNTPGVTVDVGDPVGPGSITDSVDGDDGLIDGFGTNGWSFFSGNGAGGIRFTFDAAALGGLPTRAGIVWTDGFALITFEAFDASGASLGTISGDHSDGSISGTTIDDRFYGIEHAGGIASISIKNLSGGIEVDHLQFGMIPSPSTLAILGLTLAARRRR